MLSIVKKLFGTKTDRDYKEIKPLLQQVHDIYDSVKDLDNDALKIGRAHV